MPGGEEERIRNLLVCKILHAEGNQHRTHPYEAAPVAEHEETHSRTREAFQTAAVNVR